MDKAKTTSPVMVENIKKLFLERLSSEAEPKEGRALSYRYLIGSLLYLSIYSRLKIPFPVLFSAAS